MAGTRKVKVVARILGMAALLAVACSAWAQSSRLTGEIASVVGDVLTLRIGAGQTASLHLAPTVRISERGPAQWSDIHPGSYVGATAAPQADGTLRASEVHIFGEAQRGVGEGHRPMSRPGDTMTNATVASMSGGAARGRDSMTNATVSGTSPSGNVHRMTLTYKGGQQVIVVPPDCPIVTTAPGSRDSLKPGAHVIVQAQRNTAGSLEAMRISVGRDGLTPPI
jgi:hypothetical protein